MCRLDRCIFEPKSRVAALPAGMQPQFHILTLHSDFFLLFCPVDLAGLLLVWKGRHSSGHNSVGVSGLLYCRSTVSTERDRSLSSVTTEVCESDLDCCDGNFLESDEERVSFLSSLSGTVYCLPRGRCKLPR